MFNIRNIGSQFLKFTLLAMSAPVFFATAVAFDSTLLAIAASIFYIREVARA